MLRYERKYLVPNELMNPLRARISPFVRPDIFAREKDDGIWQYTVRSIYFDTRNLDFYAEKKEGLIHRRKFRIRGYDKYQPECRVVLEIKRKILEKFTDNELYPYTKYYLRDIKERFGQYWKNHFSTIGLIGMNEASLNLLGENIATETGRNFTIGVMNFMRDILIRFQEDTGNNYNLEATPAEGATYRLARLDKAKYPEIIAANEGSKPFYTNSTHLPVNYTDDIFETLDLQDEIQTKYTGGTVLHLFSGERVANTASVKNLVNKI